MLMSCRDSARKRAPRWRHDRLPSSELLRRQKGQTLGGESALLSYRQMPGCAGELLIPTALAALAADCRHMRAIFADGFAAFAARLAAADVRVGGAGFTTLLADLGHVLPIL